MKLVVFLLVAAFAAIVVADGTIPNIDFTEKLPLKKFVDSKNCAGNDECIIVAVADYLKDRVNVIDCGFGGVEACKRKGGDPSTCTLDPARGDPGVVQMCKTVTAKGALYKGCSLYAAFMGKELAEAQKQDARCTACNCVAKTPLKSFTQMVASQTFQLTWGPGRSTPANTGTQAEHDLVLKGLGEYWNSVVGVKRGVCASLAASLAFGSRMMGVKGKLEWVKEAYESDGHEFVLYNRQGTELSNPKTGKIFDAWYYLLGQHLTADLDDIPTDYYNTANWNIQSFGNTRAKQKMILPALKDILEDGYRKRSEEQEDESVSQSDVSSDSVSLNNSSDVDEDEEEEEYDQ